MPEQDSLTLAQYIANLLNVRIIMCILHVCTVALSNNITMNISSAVLCSFFFFSSFFNRTSMELQCFPCTLCL